MIRNLAMGKNGELPSYTNAVPKESFEILDAETEKTIKNGQKIERALNTMGEVFQVQVIF